MFDSIYLIRDGSGAFAPEYEPHTGFGHGVSKEI